MNLPPGSLLLDGRFRILSPLGVGGMGDIYLGEQVSLGRRVALKVLKHEGVSDPQMNGRLEREARLLASVDHPSVVRVIDLGVADGRTVLVMELAEGRTLESLLKDGPLSVRRAVPLLCQLAEGLATIHERGIVHRDIKPENVIVGPTTRGEAARLLDFGIARLCDPGDAKITSAVVLGTPEYLSPEQALGGEVDGKSDLYSFGVLAFRMLSGVLPFPGPTARELLAQHVAAPPIPLETACPQLESMPELCALVMRCLEKEPSARPASALALAASLAKLQLGPAAPLAIEEEPRPVAREPERAPTRPPVTALSQASFPVRTPPEMSRTLALFTGPQPQVEAAQNLAVMITDIQGFTERTAHQTHEENARMLAEHDRLLLPIIRGHGGKVVQRRGDALVAVFRSPTGAVLCGMAIQDCLFRHNADAYAKDALHVRVGLHLGEILLGKDGPLGEPIATLGLLEKKVPADEVVMTEAVRLSMNRAEAPTEPFGELELPGTGQLKLYRCLRATNGVPFGGRDLAWAERSPELSDRARSTLRAVSARLARKESRPALVGAAAFGLSIALMVATADDPVKVALRAQANGDPKAALAALGNVRGSRADWIRLGALHALGSHEEELPVLADLSDERLAELAPEVAARLVADHGGKKPSPALAALLSRAPIAAAVGGIATSTEARAWPALRMLDAAGVLGEAALIDGYLAALPAKDCGKRAVAARRLGELRGEKAGAALKKLASSPRPKGLIFSGSCGHDEAATALRKLSRKSQTVLASTRERAK